MIQTVYTDRQKRAPRLFTSPVEWKLCVSLGLCRLVRTLILIIAITQAWKEGNHSVAEFMSQKITGPYLKWMNAKPKSVCEPRDMQQSTTINGSRFYLHKM